MDPPELPLRAGPPSVAITVRPSERKRLSEAFPSHGAVAEVLKRARESGVAIRTVDDDRWMKSFWDQMSDPPAALYVRGKLHEVGSPAVAIVGTRHPTQNGLQLARTLARDVASMGITIVSGMALGIDGAAHRGALDVGGHTVAVLGGGVDRPSPPSHLELAADIMKAGALVSEFPPGVPPRPLHFPRRNRIIAAMAPVLLVIEGGKRSGARSTVDHALALGREVAAVPRDPIHEGSALPNSLLRTGATPVTCATDLLELLGSTGRLGVADHELLCSLGTGARSLEGIARSLRRSDEEVLGHLGRLELAGLVRRLPGMRFVRPGAVA
jgi:DNA processing protein